MDRFLVLGTYKVGMGGLAYILGMFCLRSNY